VRSQEHIARIVEAGIPVMGHVGFTPQSEHGLGGHVVQGRGSGAEALMKDAVAVQEAGAFAVVIEMVPSAIARQVSEALIIPTIGIGAGPGTDGQILVWSDLAGLNTERVPRFVKQYASVRTVLHDAVSQWRKEITEGVFPGPEHGFEEN